MPNTRSAAKRMRADRNRHLRNLGVTSALKTLTKRFHEMLKGGQAAQARQIFPALVQELDQAARRKILHRNTASRRQARLARSLAHASNS